MFTMKCGALWALGTMWARMVASTLNNVSNTVNRGTTFTFMQHHRCVFKNVPHEVIRSAIWTATRRLNMVIHSVSTNVKLLLVGLSCQVIEITDLAV